MLLDDAVYHLRRRVGVGDVQPDGVRYFPVLLPNPGRDGLSGVCSDVSGINDRALTRESSRDRGSNAGSGPGDQANLVIESVYDFLAFSPSRLLASSRFNELVVLPGAFA